MASSVSMGLCSTHMPPTCAIQRGITTPSRLRASTSTPARMLSSISQEVLPVTPRDDCTLRRMNSEAILARDREVCVSHVIIAIVPRTL